MEHSRDSKVASFLFPKLIIFVLAVANWFYIWSHQSVQSESTVSFCYSCPWYESWSYTNAPSVLVFAAFLVLFHKWWAYLVAIGLSGGLAVYILVLLARTIANFGLSETWNRFAGSEPSFLLIWEVQLVWAGIILICAIYYISRIIRTNGI